MIDQERKQKEHIHIVNGDQVPCETCPPQPVGPTHYPPAPSLVEQALTAHKRHLQLIGDMTPEQFIKYNELRWAEAEAEHATHTPFFCKEHCNHG